MPKKYKLSFLPSIVSDGDVEKLNRPLTFEDVWKLFQETDKKFQETDKKFQETREQIQDTSRQMKETDKKFQETREQIQETSRQMKETDKKVQKTQQQIDKTSRTVHHVSKMVGGMSNTRGEVTEDFFKAALKNTKNIAGINYTYRGTLYKENGIVRGQYDIVLFGKDAIIVVEVKHKLHPDDVDDFHERRLPKFKNLFPEYNDKKLVGALAGMTIDKEAAKKALALGYLLLTQAGQKLKVISAMED
jgi:hypothetical protein